MKVCLETAEPTGLTVLFVKNPSHPINYPSFFVVPEIDPIVISHFL